MAETSEVKLLVMSHPSACPDCGQALLLSTVGGMTRYRCEVRTCEGNASAHPRDGTPYGIPVNKYGRFLRWYIHSKIDPYWHQIRVWAQQERYYVRSEIYRYMNLHTDVQPEFHVAFMTVPQLENAIPIVEERLPCYMAQMGYGLEKESTHDYDSGKTDTESIQHRPSEVVQG